VSVCAVFTGVIQSLRMAPAKENTELSGKAELLVPNPKMRFGRSVLSEAMATWKHYQHLLTQCDAHIAQHSPVSRADPRRKHGEQRSTA
jgi:hypothetical protein